MELKKFLNIDLDSVIIDLNGIEKILCRICALAVGRVEVSEKALVRRVRFIGNDLLQKCKEEIVGFPVWTPTWSSRSITTACGTTFQSAQITLSK